MNIKIRKSLRNLPTTPKIKPTGFTLIEFLVASSLALIVITAAGSTYLLTRKLNNSTQARLAIQQDLRNASTQLTRDARMAGTFGCFNTDTSKKASASISPVDFPNLPNGMQPVVLNQNNDDGYGVAVLQGSNIPAAIQALNPQSEVLVLTYGKGSAGILTSPANLTNFNQIKVANIENDQNVNQAVSNKANLVLSNCRGAITISPPYSFTGDTLTLSGGKTLGSSVLGASGGAQGELSLSQLYAAAYFIGEVGGTRGLLRTEIDNNGQWSTSPQLLVQGVRNMNISFGYVSPGSCDLDKAVNNETFDFSTTLNNKALPALIRIHMQYDTDATTRGSSASALADYIINATVRGGNACATRSPIPDTSALATP